MTNTEQVAQNDAAAKGAKPGSKQRLDYVDGCCFALVLPIILAHSARFGTTNKTVLKLLAQENIMVGGFFAIMGYITAYSSTKIGERKVDERKLANPEAFFWGRVFSYYPLHVLVSTVFAPMFLAVESYYKTPLTTTSFRALLNYSLLQAWFPKEVQMWNQPAWFLSALTFSNLAMPTVLNRTAALSKVGLQKLFGAMTAVSMLQKLSFSNTTRFHEHNIALKGPETPLIWNMTRFHPLSSLAEMVSGVTAARDVMLDTEEDRKEAVGPMVYFAAAYGSLLLRLTPFDFNDGLVRSAIFVPFYTKFLSAMHRDSQSENPSAITQLMRSAPMAKLGSLTFSMFLLHAPLGQLFFKKAVATQVWGRTMPASFFPVYLLTVLASSFLVNEHIIKSEPMQKAAIAAARWLTSATEGMLRD